MTIFNFNNKLNCNEQFILYNNKQMQLKPSLEINPFHDFKNLRTSDSTEYTDNDSIDEQLPLDNFYDLDFKKKQMSSLLSNKVHQTHITKQIILKLIDWLFGIFWRFDLDDQTIFLSLTIMQISLKNKVIDKIKLQDLGLTCMFISSKYIQVKKMQMSEILSLSNGITSFDTIVELEAEILQLLSFELQVPSFYKYFQIIRQQNQLDDIGYYKVLFWVQICLLQGFGEEIDEKKTITQINTFVLNPGQRSETIDKLIEFVGNTKYRYVMKRFSQFFDVDQYLSQIQFL